MPKNVDIIDCFVDEDCTLVVLVEDIDQKHQQEKPTLMSSMKAEDTFEMELYKDEKLLK